MSNTKFSASQRERRSVLETYDLLVYGLTPCGVTAAVRAAREGLAVLLTGHACRLGGMMACGLVQWDMLSAQHRSPLMAETFDRIGEYYSTTFGPDSHEATRARPAIDDYPNAMVEPHVIEAIYGQMTAEAETLTVAKRMFVERVDRRYATVLSVLLRSGETGELREVRADAYIDASYEADLVAAAGAGYRVGREAAEEFDEPHAGRLYTNVGPGPAPEPSLAASIGFVPFPARQVSVDPASPKTADRCIQAYNTRPCLTRDPDNRIDLTEPPPGYNRESFLSYKRKQLIVRNGMSERSIINHKATYNAPILPGENWDYPDGDWATRQAITQRHQDFALGLMYFLQNDKSVDADLQEQIRQWGFCRDEWPENHHLPEEMYVRETRRIVGLHVLTEGDLTPDPSTDRPRSFPDSVAFTDWYMDSHSCSHDATYSTPINDDYAYDGKIILTDELRPGEIPFRCLVPCGLKNMLVPLCISSTHVAWGAVRLEPCMVHLGEVAGFAAARAHHTGQAVGTLDGEAFAEHLTTRDVTVRYPYDAIVSQNA